MNLFVLIVSFYFLNTLLPIITWLSSSSYNQYLFSNISISGSAAVSSLPKTNRKPLSIPFPSLIFFIVLFTKHIIFILTLCIYTLYFCLLTSSLPTDMWVTWQERLICSLMYFSTQDSTWNIIGIQLIFAK